MKTVQNTHQLFSNNFIKEAGIIERKALIKFERKDGSRELAVASPNIGNTELKAMNRWIIVIGGILIQLALGAIYAWSAFTTPLQGSITAPSEFNFTKTETQAIFSVGLLVFAIFTIIGGRLQ